MKKKTQQTVSIIGLGKLGACYAAFYASKGFNVIGTDKDSKKVAILDKHKAPVFEPDLDMYIKKNSSRIKASLNFEQVVHESDISFIIVPTPSKPDGSFSVDYAVQAATEIGKALAKKNIYHLVVLVSTVLPEDSRTHIIPALEKSSGKICGVDFGYCYSPSLIAIGDVLNNLEHPDFLFIGEYDKTSGDLLKKTYQNVYGKRPTERMSIESAELAKISLNSYVTMKITFANVLGELCMKIPHANVDDVTNALGKDKRIGSVYFRSGLGYGGPCFPRDNFAFASVGKKRGITTPVAEATHYQNESMPKKIAHIIRSYINEKQKNIGILGLAYKTNTPISEESQALRIASHLAAKQHSIYVYDPNGFDDLAKNTLKDSVQYNNSLDSTLNKSHILFISNKDKQYQTLPDLLATKKQPKIIIDPWGMFKQEDFGTHITYIALGRK